jgi:hypothetical protein
MNCTVVVSNSSYKTLSFPSHHLSLHFHRPRGSFVSVRGSPPSQLTALCVTPNPSFEKLFFRLSSPQVARIQVVRTSFSPLIPFPCTLVGHRLLSLAFSACYYPYFSAFPHFGLSPFRHCALSAFHYSALSAFGHFTISPISVQVFESFTVPRKPRLLSQASRILSPFRSLQFLALTFQAQGTNRQFASYVNTALLYCCPGRWVVRCAMLLTMHDGVEDV